MTPGFVLIASGLFACLRAPHTPQHAMALCCVFAGVDGSVCGTLCLVAFRFLDAANRAYGAVDYMLDDDHRRRQRGILDALGLIEIEWVLAACGPSPGAAAMRQRGLVRCTEGSHACKRQSANSARWQRLARGERRQRLVRGAGGRAERRQPQLRCVGLFRMPDDSAC